MKKLILIGLGIGVLNLAQATSYTYATYTVNAPSSLGTLVGTYAYEWGVSITPLSAGQTITSAKLSFNGVVLTATGNGDNIYASLLNLSDSGVTQYTDNDVPGDFFSSSTFTGTSSSSSYYQTHSHHSLPSGYYTSLGQSQQFSLNASPANWTIDPFTSGELGALNTDALDGNFDIGIDPDCHYNIQSITFTYTVSTPVSVPDTATTAGLLGMSFLGLLAFRRKLALQ
jgi:hypothetical protein